MGFPNTLLFIRLKKSSKAFLAAVGFSGLKSMYTALAKDTGRISALY